MSSALAGASLPRSASPQPPLGLQAVKRGPPLPWPGRAGTRSADQGRPSPPRAGAAPPRSQPPPWLLSSLPGCTGCAETVPLCCCEAAAHAHMGGAPPGAEHARRGVGSLVQMRCWAGALLGAAGILGWAGAPGAAGGSGGSRARGKATPPGNSESLGPALSRASSGTSRRRLPAAARWARSRSSGCSCLAAGPCAPCTRPLWLGSRSWCC